MNNALEYLSWRGDLTFAQSPVNEVDLFLCSQIVTPDYSGIVPSVHKPVALPDVAARYFGNHTLDVAILGALQSDSVLPMLKVLPDYPRFAETTLFSYVQKISKEAGEQFCAVTVGFPDGSVCVSYQGTDDTIIGWKEDFNIAVYETVPAQLDAAEYLEKVARSVKGPIYIVGHSKGGNLAVYAAANASPKVRERIVRVISFDGPGFRASFFEKEGYRAVRDRIETIMSQNAMVGVLLGLAGRCVIVKTHNKGPLAHDGFSWEVRGSSFVRCASLSKESRNFDRTIDAVLKSVTPEECVDFVDGLFDALFATGSVTVTDLKRLKLNQVILVIYRFAAKKRLSKTVNVLINAIFHTKRLPANPDPVTFRDSDEAKEGSSEIKEAEMILIKEQEMSQLPETEVRKASVDGESAEKAKAKTPDKHNSPTKAKTPLKVKKTPEKKQEPADGKKKPVPNFFDLFAQPKPKKSRSDKKPK